MVRKLVSAGELSLSCARLLVGWVTTLWLSRPPSVSQHGQLSHPSLRVVIIAIHVIRYMDYGVKAQCGWGVVRLAAGPKSVARAMGAASLRRGTIANASQLPLPRL